ncbi:GntR family transcriptional regulator [Phyllobacterium chamaecytisi]|uniref:GntR family transcriptional regulator n=1 Tax=Phyllobacterium chamaecytisi TaxID=2876082 RepID=UPI001CCD02CA|nr:GntR family transcriptional regulator [Phyllobacterium sp. KW56]MBZ9603870.1 GntR family transcriptional regulator [Phyllobacterium sp. KW56]
MRLQKAGKLSSIAPPAEAAQDVVYRWLKQHVLTLPRHEATFVTEAEVCRATGSSRTPVREALLRLESDGFLRIVPKKGAYVAAITEADVESVMQARGLVEDWCVRRAALIGEPLAALLDQFVVRQAELQQSPVTFIECDREFHRTIVRSAGNPILADFYETLRDRQLRMGVQAIAASEERTSVVLVEHAAIVEAIRSGDPERAAASIAVHLSNTLLAMRSPATAGWVRSTADTHGSRF